MKKKKIIIIGGGTAGLTIANRLQDKFEVIIVEKSKYKKYPLIYKIPSLIGLLYRAKKLRYLKSRNLKLSNGRLIPYYESNTFGGASVINGCVHVLGSKKLWEIVLKKFNLSYDDLLDSYSYLYSENNLVKNKINLSSASQTIIDKSFIQTLNILGIPRGNTNHADSVSCGPILNTVNRYFRSSVLSLFSKNKFKLYLDEDVQQIIFNEKNEAIGVKTDQRNIKGDHIILSGGVIGSCKILLTQKYRNNKSFDNINLNNEIGKDIQDHTNLRINVLTNKKIGSFNEISNNFYLKFLIFIKHLIGIPTLMKGTGATSAVHLDLNGDGVVDTRIQIVQFSETGRHGSDGKIFSSDQPGFSLSITVINPKSRGIIELDGKELKIDPMYLSKVEDIEMLEKAMTFCMRLLKSKPINDHILKIENQNLIEKNPKKYIFENIFSGAHLSGGIHKLIDDNFRLKGFKALYVCDASVLEKYVASNMHSSVVLIADMFAKNFVKKII